jgi:hypothetical protein
VSQPWHRKACCPLPGKLDSNLKEWWSENPWDIVREGHNLSCFERKRVFLNARGRDFLDISALTGADGDGDGRSIVAGDFRNNGQMDLVLRQAGGGPLIVYENRFPRRHYLEVSLRGKTGNRLGIGARLTALAGGQQLVRELYPLNSFRSQMPCVVHFGLGEATRVERLTIRWPSGQEQTLTDLAADRHIVVDEGGEGKSAVHTVIPGQTIAP